MNIQQFVKEQYDIDTLNDIVQHGCVSGCATDFIYYSDTCDFYDVHHEEIWNMLYDDASDQGITIIEMLAQFNGQKDVGRDAQFKNMLVWYAVEKVAYDLLNNEE